MSALQQHHMTADGGTHNNEHPLAIFPMGIRHGRFFSHGRVVTQVPRCGDRLLHQMGRSQTISHYHGEEHPELCLEKYHLPLRNSQSPRL